MAGILKWIGQRICRHMEFNFLWTGMLLDGLVAEVLRKGDSFMDAAF